MLIEAGTLPVNYIILGERGVGGGVIVLEAGSIEITNTNVNKAMMNTGKTVEEHKKVWFEETEETSKALFKIAEDCVEKDKQLHVIIMKRPQRFDRTSSDILGIKQKISEYGNKIYDQCILRSSYSDRIHLMELNLTQDSKYLKDLIYGQSDNPRFDGIHLSGSGASRHFTYRVVQNFKQIFQNWKSKSKMLPSSYSHRRNERIERVKRHSDVNDHTNCPQAQYLRKQRGNIADMPRHYVSYASAVKSNIRGGQTISFSIPTRNRFDQLPSQGNW